MSPCLHNHLIRIGNMKPGTYQCEECLELFTLGPLVRTGPRLLVKEPKNV